MRGQSENGLVYTQKTGAQDLYKMMKAVGIPVIVFLASLVCITIMGIFGRKLVAPCVALMWASGAVVAIVFPNHRRSSIAEAYTFILVYVSSLLVLRMLLSWMSGISTESLAASFDQPVSIITVCQHWMCRS